MDAFALGLVIGLALGLSVVGFLAIGAYERGLDEAVSRRREWRSELANRRVRVHRPLSQAS